MAGVRFHSKVRAAVVAVAGLVLAGAAAWALAQQAAPSASAAQVAPAAKPAVPAKTTQKALDKPLWRDLSPAQQVALEPLAAEWDTMEGLRKQKWMGMAKSYSSMKPDEQQRMHERMRDWIKLTPEQRRLARENYTRTKKIDPSEKSAQWEQYQQLPEEQKKKLAEEAAMRKRQLTNLPSKAQAGVKTVPPIKHGPPPQPACPAGTVTNAAASTPPCVAAPVPAAVAPASTPGTPPVPVTNVK